VEGAVYLLCAATALACGALLLRGYRRTRGRLLLWSGSCFLALTFENALLFVDRVLYKSVDLSALHVGASCVGVALLCFGLIWEDK
jgi:hypothetical protein